MRHKSLYLDWYIQVPKVKYDFRSSGVSFFKCDLALKEADLGINYPLGNLKAVNLLAQRYHTQPENVFLSSEGASGQNARVIRYIAERNEKKNEAIVEYPTYEPLLRQVQEHFPKVKRVERQRDEAYRLDAGEIQRIVSERTGLLVLTNPNAPTGAISNRNELEEIMNIARNHGFFVLCDEIYAEFDRDLRPTIFSVDPEWGIVTTSLTKVYGLGGLRMGIAIIRKELVKELHLDKLNTIGASSNIVENITVKLLTESRGDLERHKERWVRLKEETEDWLNEKGFEYFPNKVGITFWIKTPIKDTYRWINEHAIPQHSLAAVPGTFFLFKSNYKLTRSDMIRLSLGNVNPEKQDLIEALTALEKAQNTY